MPITNGKYINPGWVNGQPPAINASELNAISDTLQHLNGIGGSRGDYVVVGTSTAGATVTTCDFLCDGTADDVEINAAIQQAKALNLDVLLLNGIYNIADTINLTTNMRGIRVGTTSINRTSTQFQYAIHMTESSSLSDLTVICMSFLQSEENVELFLENGCVVKNVSIYNYPNIAVCTNGDKTEPGGIYSSISLDGVSTTASPNGSYSLQLIKCTGDENPCYIKNCSFDKTAQLIYCGNFSGVFVSNCGFKDLDIVNCQLCGISNNSFSGSISVSQSGSSPSVCTSNIISANSFYSGGITLGTGTEKNLVTGNGGGVDATWSGVTDNGSNNYVANNMPT